MNYILGGLLFLSALSIAIAGIYFYFNGKADAVDPVTLCPVNGPKGHYVLLVDKTDPLTFTQKEAFSVMLREIIERRTPEGYLLSVFVLGEDYRENAKQLMELCNPGTGEGKSQATSNPKMLRQRFEKKFLEPLIMQSDALTATKAANASPIFEMMQLVGINAFRKHDVKGERRLFIMSDMLHNTPQFSMYEGPIEYPVFENSSYGKKMQLELPGVEVELRYLMNTPRLQTKRNLKFWEDYFSKAGARIVEVRPL